MMHTQHSSMPTMCVPKRAFRIGVICVILIPIAKVMAKIPKHAQNCLNQGNITISCPLCVDLPAQGISAQPTYSRTTQHHLTRILQHHIAANILFYHFADRSVLASWFRLKYPHVAIGALASSAPILYFDDITPQDGYYSIVTKDFREASETCYQTIKNSWSIIDEIGSKPDGLSVLSKTFKTCKPLKSVNELKSYLKLMYASAAQYNSPPRYPVTIVCGGIDGSVPPKTDILDKVFAGVVAYYGNRGCYVNAPQQISETTVGWRWQTCTEMVIPIGITNNTMFQPSPFNLSSFIEECRSLYGVPPRPHWVTTYYGGHDIKLVLHKFGSNIIFSNGLRDPYSSGGVLVNISESIVAVHTVNGSHCLDILRANQSTDPEWLVRQREVEVQIIKGWITQYYFDLSLSVNN